MAEHQEQQATVAHLVPAYHSLWRGHGDSACYEHGAYDRQHGAIAEGHGGTKSRPEQADYSARQKITHAVKSLAEFPPRQRPEHWSIGDVLEKLQQKAQTLEAASGGGVK
jgi:hypothetical protein